MSTSECNKIFVFRKKSLPGAKDLKIGISDFWGSNKSILRLDFFKVSFDYQVREILVNAIGGYLLNEARAGNYKNNPLVVFIDEAH